MAFDKGFLNVWLLSIAFMLLFTAFQCLGIIMKTILEGAKKENPEFNADGYLCLAIVYISFAIVNWFAPSIISLIGPKATMCIGAVSYIGYIFSFLYPEVHALYIMSAVLGIGAALIWTGQGNYLIINTPKEEMSRNCGIFWAMLQLSMIFGNTLIYFLFSGIESVETNTRLLVIFILSGIAVASFVVFIILPKSVRQDDISSDKEDKPGPIEVLRGAGRLFKTKHVAFLYGGLELAYFSGVYGSSVGFSLQLTNSKSLIGLSGILIGCGEVLGGTLFGIFGAYTAKIGRSTIVIFGCVLHLITYGLIFINLPNNSPFGDTNDEAIITSSAAIAVGCGFSLGLADACFNTQFYTAIGTSYQNNSASAFAIFKFVQNVGAFIGFLYSTHLIMYGNLGLLAGCAIIGTICFIIADKIEVNEEDVVKYKTNIRTEATQSSNA
ncbi:UNC93-like protein MFSD11 [Coccinella septempunctata]|uniref:UNC93-like protein MFSD11 n=1 Tax=Coccinella septempunctata TaxID=41139 RepID=UPI001D05C4A3|nr:UNC93-like protein MFSD11 [Coccinella septempunctata]